MIDANPAPAIIKNKEEFSTTCMRAKQWADEWRQLPANGMHALTSQRVEEVTRELVKTRAHLDILVRGFLDGENSIEDRWERMCAIATTYFYAFSAAEDPVRALFEDHLNFLRSIHENPGIRAMEEAGFAVPSVAKIDEAIQRTEGYRDRVLERWPLTLQELEYAFPVDVEEVVYIPPMAFLRSMVTIVWNVFRHPFSTTYVDLSTGESVTFGDEAE